MKTLTITFKDGDIITLECMDVVVNQGFLTIFMPVDEFGTKTVQAYNIDMVADFEFVQRDEEENEE